jgi:hypothetical protein
MKKLIIFGLFLTASIVGLNSCGGSLEKDIVGQWTADLSSLDVKLGDGIPPEFKPEVEAGVSEVKGMQFVAEQVVIDFKEGGVLTVGPTGETKDFSWKVDGSNLVLSGELEGQKFEFSIEVTESSADKVVLHLTAESAMEQMKKVMGAEFDEAMAEMPEGVDVNAMVKGTSATMTLKKKA